VVLVVVRRVAALFGLVGLNCVVFGLTKAVIVQRPACEGDGGVWLVCFT